MGERTLDEQITKYLTDIHSIEEQALAQMRAAPKIAGSPALAAIYAEHCTETEGQERDVRAALEARGARQDLERVTVAVDALPLDRPHAQLPDHRLAAPLLALVDR